MVGDRVLLSLELSLEAHPVRGVMRVPGAPAVEFSGWTELFAALDAALATGEPRAITPPGAGRIDDGALLG